MIGTLLLAIIVGFVVIQSFLLEAHICEVCIEYKGRTQCREVGGTSQEEAQMAAITNACAFLSGGVTDSMACARTAPQSVTCR